MNYRKRKCRCCGEWFMPQAHTAYHQSCCSKAECQQGRKRHNQRRWRRRNRGHFTGDWNIARVRDWRQAHPGRPRLKPPARLLITLRTVRRTARKRTFSLRSESRKTGRVQDFCLPQLPARKPVRFNLALCVQDLFGIRVENCYS